MALLGVVLFGSSGAVAAWPSLDRVSVGGVPLSWLVLAFATYPALLLLALSHVRRAERAERRRTADGRGDGP